MYISIFSLLKSFFFFLIKIYSVSLGGIFFLGEGRGNVFECKKVDLVWISRRIQISNHGSIDTPGSKKLLILTFSHSIPLITMPCVWGMYNMEENVVDRWWSSNRNSLKFKKKKYAIKYQIYHFLCTSCTTDTMRSVEKQAENILIFFGTS